MSAKLLCGIMATLRDVAVDGRGRVYVSDTGNKRIQVFDADLRHLHSFGGLGIVDGRLDEPVGLAIGPEGLLYVADTWNDRVQVFTLDGELCASGRLPAGTANPP